MKKQGGRKKNKEPKKNIVKGKWRVDKRKEEVLP